MSYNWKILEVHAENDLIVSARYFCSANENDNTIETEGWWYFNEPSVKTPFNQVTEAMVIEWVKAETMKDGFNMIEARLSEQLQATEKEKKVTAPWLPQVFTVQL